jgi:hypothetical protein
MTRSSPYWTTSVFSAAVTDLVLIYESVTSLVSVVRWLTLYSWTLNLWIHLRMNRSSLNGSLVHRIFFSYGATAPIWALAYLHETLRFTSVY